MYVQSVWKVFQQDGCCALFNGFPDKPVAVNLCPFHGDEQMTVLNPAAVNVHAFDFNVRIAVDGNGADVLE